MGQSAVFDATAWLFVFARVGAVMMLLPAFGEETIPPRVRLVMALLVSLALTPVVAPQLNVDVVGDALTFGMVREVAIGLALGALVRILYLSIAMAGSIIATQAGFSMVFAFDPSMGGQAPALGRLMSVGALIFIFATDIHHLLIAGMAKSYMLTVPGFGTASRDLADIAVSTVGRSFAIALQISAPFLIFGFVLNVGLGMIARLAPSIQIFFIAQPFVVLSGMALLLTCLAGGLSVWTRLFGTTIRAALG